MKVLVVIPARGGSKGIPHKNIKPLNGKPLIYYSIDVARQFTTDEDICVSTDDDEIIKVVEEYGLKVPFKRPDYLATDICGSNEVIQHAWKFFENKGDHYDVILLLQPTSPFRKVEFLKEAVALYDDSIDMVTSVKNAPCNPYYDGFEDNEEGLLTISKGDGTIERRQDAPKVWQLNGSIYVINPKSLMQKGLAHFTRIRKYAMSELYSVDIDNAFDWKIAELIIEEKLLGL
ncbi:N-acylneuraminate cytidylyltransferase [Prevotella communis]|uniref:N-acylneuraminate cytidylyltransferase n=1 Tax=Prevotella communis TaxID=2913614 RepID=A0A1G8ASH0_9BACT|nr:acylneuraminate cytidylyltransferase family protein [Prevotella communis]SDH24012.1 N-acylneuraminate cytidylyltransferase [Prevotella communis]